MMNNLMASPSMNQINSKEVQVKQLQQYPLEIQPFATLETEHQGLHSIRNFDTDMGLLIPDNYLQSLGFNQEPPSKNEVLNDFKLFEYLHRQPNLVAGFNRVFKDLSNDLRCNEIAKIEDDHQVLKAEMGEMEP